MNHYARIAAPVLATALAAGASRVVSGAPGNTPQLLSPEQGAVLDNGRSDGRDIQDWTFQWAPVTGAGRYNLHVSGPKARIPMIDVQTSETTYRSVTVGGRVLGSRAKGWVWKVRAFVNGQWSSWSEPRTFDVEPPDTDPPSLEIARPRRRNDLAGLTAHFLQTLAIQQRLAPGSLVVAGTLNTLGDLVSEQGDLAGAKAYYEQALEIGQQRASGSPLEAVSLNGLGGVAWSAGDLAGAKAYFEQALEIRQQPAPDSAVVAVSLSGLGNVAWSAGDLAGAKARFEEALEIRQRLAPGSMLVASSLNNLGIVAWNAGDLGDAAAYYERSLAILERLAPGRRGVAGALNNLGLVALERGDRASARLYFEKALAIMESLAPGSSDVARSLTNLAMVEAVEGRNEESLRLVQQASDLDARQIDNIFGITSEREKLAYLLMMRWRTNIHLALAGHGFPANGEVASWAMGLVMQRKGLVLESLVRQRYLVASDESAHGAFDQWRNVTQQLAVLTLRGAGREGPESHRAKLESLTARKEKLEAELSRLSAAFAVERDQRRVEPGMVARCLSADSALVELVRVRMPDQFVSANRSWLPAHYLAFVLSAEGRVVRVDLGEADRIDSAVADWRETLSRSAELAARVGEAVAERRLAEKGEVLHDQVFGPIADHLGDVETVFLAPDGLLNLVPFGALPDERGSYLIERFRFNYVGSGRELLRFGRESPAPGRPILIAAPDFGLPAAKRLAQVGRKLPRPTLLAQSLAGTRSAAALQGTRFLPLPGTAQEAQEIAALLIPWEPAVHTGAQALEEVLKSVRSPQLLHVATHGFFLDDQDLRGRARGRAMASSEAAWQRLALAGIENPLLRSGLALAGANRFGEEDLVGSEDGILTALEISGLDLTGTDLVVLSACDTGLGEVKNGEGVFGLRRAFLHAGAKTVIMSLAKVRDQETRDLMVEFYKRWLESGDKVKALHDAQLAIMKKRRAEHGAAHPLYWGTFIAVGEP